MLRRILPAGAEPDFRDPSGTIRVDQIPAARTLGGPPDDRVPVPVDSRIAWIDRLGEGIITTRDSVIQEGDIMHLVMREENAGHVYDVIAAGPED